MLPSEVVREPVATGDCGRGDKSGGGLHQRHDIFRVDEAGDAEGAHCAFEGSLRVAHRRGSKWGTENISFQHRRLAVRRCSLTGEKNVLAYFPAARTGIC